MLQTNKLDYQELIVNDQSTNEPKTEIIINRYDNKTPDNKVAGKVGPWKVSTYVHPEKCDVISKQPSQEKDFKRYVKGITEKDIVMYDPLSSIRKTEEKPIAKSSQYVLRVKKFYAYLMSCVRNVFKREIKCYITITIPPFQETIKRKNIETIGIIGTTPSLWHTSEKKIPSYDIRQDVENKNNRNYQLTDENGENLTDICIKSNFNMDKSVMNVVYDDDNNNKKKTIYFTQAQFNVMVILFLLNLYIYEFCNQYECPLKNDFVRYFNTTS